MKHEISEYFKSLQDNICKSIELTDDKGKFKEDNWQHQSGGGGRTRVLSKGRIIEKGGVNFSAVEGMVSESLKKMLKVKDDLSFFATGVSIVMHPENPFVPIIHMNVRYFELSDGQSWFGGGIDLTPHYIDEKQAKWFHTKLKTACDAHNSNFYPAFNKWADDYFYIEHRNETRGIGGIFYDYLKPNQEISKTKSSHSKDELFAFTKSVGESFAPIYTELMHGNYSKAYTSEEKKWQLLRRGRYVEFNLVWDRGTKFGLETNGRTESILMSLPPHADWDYNVELKPGTKEFETQQFLKKGVNWI
ncbi:oxygen-dependent coproporphyrinogen oxidase [Lacihabitans sp. LS3-19]|uniref:oxygen-dependent coproporphyrinogen oxidase n=1 Tax=Lacihabitans sp. LS3-19 TaxID=2487335 RepID=UPI0020CCEFA1|nr:oxygen-dependent coproporphyrinogen oxidase [Lacihabitans sp. LS3-19]MCP9769985.1 oxygen-dependent coproporphyrinogen oxidase [Lacihabitans sp. LS3-19]